MGYWNIETLMTKDRYVLAWVIMVTMLALHFIDEAFNDFLSFYNPLVGHMQESAGFTVMPTFKFWYWIVGLIIAITVGYLATPLVAKRARGVKTITMAVGVLMILNCLGHLGASVSRGELVPGTLSTPLLLLASLYLVFQGLRRQPS
jgi:hypothetical protein